MPRRLGLLALLTALSAACGGSCDEGGGTAQWGPCRSPELRDEEGGALILRGVSVSAGAKWSRDRLPPISREDLLRLEREMGLDAIRLLVFWEAIEPLPGVYDDAYVDAVGRFVETAGEAGLHVIVDMHQDVYGRGFGHGGAPRWTCDEDLYATYEEPESWFLGYIEPEVMQCFDRFYRDEGTRAAFAGAWAKLAERLRGTPGLVAYELLNEPFWGTSTAGKFEREVAPDLYREIIDVVRLEDRDTWIGVQPAPTASVGVPTELPRIDRERVMYMPHFYPVDVELGRGYYGDTRGLREQLGAMCNDARRLRTPLVIGEVGVRRDVQGASEYLADAYGLFDEARIGAFYWDLSRGGASSYGIWDREGRPAMQALQIARPYPRRISGRPVRWHWREPEGIFVSEWEETDDATGDSLVALPELAFPHGVDPYLEPPGPWRLENGTLFVERIGGPRRLTVLRRSQPTELATTRPEPGDGERPTPPARDPAPRSVR